MATASTAKSGEGAEPNPLRFYHLRNWMGMPVSVWFSLWARNRFAFSPSRWYQVVRMCAFAPLNSLLRGLDAIVYGRAVRRAPPPKPPLFVIGHWRTGTTMLHELLIQDEQFAYPSSYQVMTPHHFLLSRHFAPFLLAHALPSKRPMDNMAFRFDLPQEDEFALCNLGVPSPYLKWAFPNRPVDDRYLDLEGLSKDELRRWTEAFSGFVRRLSFLEPRRVVLKSPTHTARVRHLLKIFPGAQFVHIVRDPRAVFPSTVHTWKQLRDALGFQTPDFAGLEEYVFESFERMYRAFDQARPLLGARQLCEIRYEDLIANPVSEIGKVYEGLGLEGFERVRPRLVAYFAERKEYRTNRFTLTDETRERLRQRWSGYCERYGYECGDKFPHLSKETKPAE